MMRRGPIHAVDVDPQKRAALGIPAEADAMRVVWPGGQIHPRGGPVPDRDWPDHDLELVGVRIDADALPTGPLGRSLGLPWIPAPELVTRVRSIEARGLTFTPREDRQATYLDLYEVTVRRRDSDALMSYAADPVGGPRWTVSWQMDGRKGTREALFRLRGQLEQMIAPRGRQVGTGKYRTEADFVQAIRRAEEAMTADNVQDRDLVTLATYMRDSPRTLRRYLTKWPQDLRLDPRSRDD